MNLAHVAPFVRLNYTHVRLLRNGLELFRPALRHLWRFPRFAFAGTHAHHSHHVQADFQVHAVLSSADARRPKLALQLLVLLRKFLDALVFGLYRLLADVSYPGLVLDDTAPMYSSQGWITATSVV